MSNVIHAFINKFKNYGFCRFRNYQPLGGYSSIDYNISIMDCVCVCMCVCVCVCVFKVKPLFLLIMHIPNFQKIPSIRDKNIQK